MKTLQNNFTSPEQSKRLLELGVPADSADMYIECYWCDRSNGRWRHKADSHEMFGDRKQIGEGVGAIRPCWSVGRLMEIYHICISNTTIYGWSYHEDVDGNYIDYIIQEYVDALKYEELDFSKLEE